MALMLRECFNLFILEGFEEHGDIALMPWLKCSVEVTQSPKWISILELFILAKKYYET